MEFRIDLKGDASAAERGAAALRDESAAAKSASASIDAMGKSAAVLEASTKAAQGLADALSSVAKASEEAAKARQPAFSGASDQDFKRSVWEGGGKGSSDVPAKKASAAEDEKRGKAAQKAGSDQLKALKGASAATKDIIIQQADATAGLLKYGAAMAGIGGAAELTKIAIGWKGMAALQMTSFKATQDVRRLFTGLDSTPLLRAASRLEQNLSKSTATGNVLSNTLQRGFSGFFGAIEKVEPLVESFAQGILIGAVKAEGALYKLETAFAPQVVALEDFAGSEGAMEDAAIAGAVALGGLATAAAAVAAPFVAAGAAVTFLIDQYRKLKAEIAGAGGAMQAIKDMGKFNMTGTGAGAEKLAQNEGRAVFERNQARYAQEKAAAAGGKAPDAAPAGAGGEAVGKSVADGIVAGLDKGGSAVKAAGKRAGENAVTGAREGADAHSPSEATKKLGRDINEGAIVGMNETAPRVRDAADKALAPAVAPRGGAATSAPSSTSTTIQIDVNITGANAEGLRAAAQPVAAEIRSALIRLGLPVPGVP